MVTEPTPEEVEDETLACQRLWELDTNRLTPEVRRPFPFVRSIRIDVRRRFRAPETALVIVYPMVVLRVEGLVCAAVGDRRVQGDEL